MGLNGNVRSTFCPRNTHAHCLSVSLNFEWKLLLNLRARQKLYLPRVCQKFVEFKCCWTFLPETLCRLLTYGHNSSPQLHELFPQHWLLYSPKSPPSCFLLRYANKTSIYLLVIHKIALKNLVVIWSRIGVTIPRLVCRSKSRFWYTSYMQDLWNKHCENMIYYNPWAAIDWF